VAFALAAVSYGNADFPQRCAGIPDFPTEYCGDDNMTDSLAILQAQPQPHPQPHPQPQPQPQP